MNTLQQRIKSLSFPFHIIFVAQSCLNLDAASSFFGEPTFLTKLLSLCFSYWVHFETPLEILVGTCTLHVTLAVERTFHIYWREQNRKREKETNIERPWELMQARSNFQRPFLVILKSKFVSRKVSNFYLHWYDERSRDYKSCCCFSNILIFWKIFKVNKA